MKILRSFLGLGEVTNPISARLREALNELSIRQLGFVAVQLGQEAVLLQTIRIILVVENTLDEVLGMLVVALLLQLLWRHQFENKWSCIYVVDDCEEHLVQLTVIGGDVTLSLTGRINDTNELLGLLHVSASARTKADSLQSQC